MSITLIGLIVVLIGALLLFTASRLAMLGLVLACSLLNGSAALIVTALGSVSIQPALIACAFLALRCAVPGRRHENLLATSLADNGWLILLAGYSAAGAFTLPFLFADTIALVPLRPTNNPLGLTAYPLRFSPQNITTACYMLATLTAALCAHVAARRGDAAARVARAASMIGLVHVGIGWFALATKDTALQAAATFFRNGSYMQLDQSFAGFARLTGISPEPSLYASYALIWFVFTTELWLRNVDRRWSGAASLTLLLTLAASTSTTAYVGLAAYSAVLLVRQLFLVGTIPAAKGLAIAGCLAVFAASALALAAGSDEAARALARVLRLTTTEKLDSSSGTARVLWARQGIGAFFHSWGLGVGAGSFRSSSIVTAVLGSSGVIGLGAMLLYLRQVFRPFAAATWQRSRMIEADVSTAAAWVVVMVLVPASVSAPSPDPGLVWGLLAGAALGLRRAAAARWLAARAGTTASNPVVLADAARPAPGYRANTNRAAAGSA